MVLTDLDPTATKHPCVHIGIADGGRASLADPRQHPLGRQNYWTLIAGLVEMPLSDGLREGWLGLPDVTG
jgi:hypothetical protein